MLEQKLRIIIDDKIAHLTVQEMASMTLCDRGTNCQNCLMAGKHCDLFKKPMEWIAAGNNPDRFTGLKDSKGNEIYEGDIVKINWNDGLQDKETVGRVFYSPDVCMFLIDDKKRRDFPLMQHMKFTIIGNIYQRPELIEGLNNA